jgi:hypothetical protein
VLGWLWVIKEVHVPNIFHYWRIVIVVIRGKLAFEVGRGVFPGDRTLEGRMDPRALCVMPSFFTVRGLDKKKLPLEFPRAAPIIVNN